MDVDDDTKKRPPLNDTVSDNFSNKKPKPQTLNQDGGQNPFDDILNDDVFAELSMDEDELSKLLDTPPTCPFPYSTTCPAPPCPVKFAAYPYVSPPVEYSSTSYVTINGNEETCGSSFSDTDSSIMASFDTACVNIADPLALWGLACGGAWGGLDDSAAVRGVGEGGCPASGDDWDWNDLLFGDDVGNQVDLKGLFGIAQSN